MPGSEDFERAFAESEPPRRGSGPDVRRVALVAGVAALALLVVLVMASGQGGIIEVDTEQVAVITNYITGESVVHQQPGYKFFVPFMQQGFLFDKSVQEFVMQGNHDIDSNHVKKLTVRANDGSNLWFDEMQIQYRILPTSADVVLSDSGGSEAFKANWVRAYARSILRDEFGKFSSSDIADPTNYNTAAAEAKERLNSILRQHGIDIIRIKTPKPKFDAHYEQAIEDRKVANQEVERIKARAEQLRRERERLLAEIDATKAVEYEALKGTLNADFKVAQKEKVRVERSADAYKTKLLGDGKAAQARLLEQARGMREKAIREAEGLRSKTDALAKQGGILVRERLAQRLADIEFSLVPYTKDDKPDRVELESDDLAASLGGGR